MRNAHPRQDPKGTAQDSTMKELIDPSMVSSVMRLPASS